MSSPVPLYFGCWRDLGHNFHTADGRSAVYRSGPPTPWGYGVEKLPPQASKAQGDAAVHHKDGWTALAIHDYTVDSRGNSKSVFCFPEVLGFDDAWAAAREHFPTIATRVGTPRLIASTS